MASGTPPTTAGARRTRPVRVERPERPERPQRTDRDQRGMRTQRTQRPDRPPRPDTRRSAVRTERPVRAAQPGAKSASIRGRRVRRPRPAAATNSRFRGRLALLVLLGLLAVASVKLVTIQVIDTANYAAKSEAQRTRTIKLLAERGTVSDRDGAILAFTVEGRAVAARPALFTDDAQRRQVAEHPRRRHHRCRLPGHGRRRAHEADLRPLVRLPGAQPHAGAGGRDHGGDRSAVRRGPPGRRRHGAPGPAAVPRRRRVHGDRRRHRLRRQRPVRHRGQVRHEAARQGRQPDGRRGRAAI